MYKLKKVNSVTFQQSHLLTLDVVGNGERYSCFHSCLMVQYNMNPVIFSTATGASTSSVELETCLANYFAEEVLTLQSPYSRLLLLTTSFGHIVLVLVVEY